MENKTDSKDKKLGKILEFETFKLPKIYTPYTYIKCNNKLNEARERYAKLVHDSIDPLNNNTNIDLSPKNVEKLIKSTMSIKYLGINAGQIGVISKRVPLSFYDSKAKLSKNKPLKTNPEKNEYIVDKYALPRSMHSIPKIEKTLSRKKNIGLQSFMDFSFEKYRNNHGIEKEIRKNVRRIIEKKKEKAKEGLEQKLKLSLETWEQLKKNEKIKIGYSYSGLLKIINEGNKKDHNLKKKLKNIKKSIYY